jgi:hypothetical protein
LAGVCGFSEGDVIMSSRFAGGRAVRDCAACASAVLAAMALLSSLLSEDRMSVV